MSKSPASLVVTSLFFAIGLAGQQQSAPAIDAAMRKATASKVGELLAEHYVFADVGGACRDLLQQQLSAGVYDQHADADAFALAVTGDLQGLTKDKHLRVRARRVEAVRQPDGERQDDRLERARRGNYGFRKVEVLDDNIGYLDLRGFLPAEHAGDTAVAAMALLQNTDAMIIDLRNNTGGSPTMVQLISSYFFARPTHLNSMAFRGREQVDQFWTLPHVPGKRRPDVPLYVLTSSRTFSAAEEFANNLKELGRATIVGEVTGGGAHPGGLMPVNECFEIWIPRGRAINPISNGNWEGSGVRPDIEVAADDALARACAHARELLEGQNAGAERDR